jgi:hypothetical protein
LRFDSNFWKSFVVARLRVLDPRHRRESSLREISEVMKLRSTGLVRQ